MSEAPLLFLESNAIYMSKHLRLCLLVILGFVTHLSFGQNYRIENGRINVCPGQFTDSRGTGLFGNYRNNENFTYTICPDEPGRRIRLFFERFRIAEGDILCFYDGPNTNANLLSCWDDKESQSVADNIFDNFDRPIQATLENSSGCLTVTFRSDDSQNAAGWRAEISCEFACQDILAEIASSSPEVIPADTGWISVCLGEPITLRGRGEYPQASQPDTYAQSDQLSTFNWDMGDGIIREGQSITHTYNQPGGYIVELNIQDPLGCSNNNAITQRVRVATPPKFVMEPIDTLCIGDTIALTSAVNQGVISGKTISAVPDSGSFEAINIRADSIALPDGEGVFYESPIRFTTFSPGQTITSETDIRNIFVNMEHTWMRDLEIELECPNGQIMTLHDFDGQRGREVYLGIPNDNDNTQINIGEGYTYSWNLNGQQTWIEYANANFANTNRATLPVQDYRPFDDFSELIGCPLNGNWTMRIKDLWLFDNGFIFFWGMELDEDLVPTEQETFVPEIQQYSWSGPDILDDNRDSTLAVALTEGNLPFTFSTTDEFGCQKDTTINLTVRPEDHPECVKCETRFTDRQGPTAVCSGIGVDLEIRTNPELDFYDQFTYSWSPADGLSCTDCPNPVATPASTTVYEVFASSSTLNCEFRDTIEVRVSDTPPPSIQGITANSPVCEGEGPGSAIVEVTGGTGTLSFAWNNGAPQTTNTLTGLAPGDYDLTVTDINGCSDNALFTIDPPAPRPVVDFSISDVTCTGDSTGSILVEPVIGSAPFTYIWSTGESTPQIDELPAGDYFITITDANGCTALDTATVIEPNTPPIQVAVQIDNEIICRGDASGAITVNTTGGQGNYTYNWNNGATTPSLTTLPEGTYVVTVTDEVGCSKVEEITLTGPTEDLVEIEITNPILCPGTTTGGLNAPPMGGQAPYTFTWSNGQNTQALSNLSSGTYTVTITDANGCTEESSMTLDEPQGISINTSIPTSIQCAGDSNGSLQLTVTGGQPPYQYQWSTGATTPLLQNLSAGAYGYTVTDANGCSRDSTLVLNEPSPLSIATSVLPPSCFDTNDGAITLTPAGGTPPFQYQLNGGAFSSNSSLGGVGTGSQTIVIQDANGCQITEQIAINEPEELIVFASADPEIIQLGDLTTLEAEAQNGTGQINFQWTTFRDTKIECSDCREALISPMRSNTFQVTATDQNGCQATDMVQVTVEIDRVIMVPTGFTPNGDATNDLLLVHGNSGSIVNSFKIYDRWGELLFEAQGFEVNDPTIGWDGNYRGKYAPAGVYIWQAEVTFIDGYQKVYKGHTNLIR